MSGPFVTIDLKKIEQNAREITGFCGKYGISVTGVTKVTCGMPQVAQAMLKGGVLGIGESRLENIRRLKTSGILAVTPVRNDRIGKNIPGAGKKTDIPIMLLRIPPISEVDEIVTSVDISLNSEISVIRGLSDAAQRRGLVHDIILMVDLGDLREGMWPADLMPAVKEIITMRGVRIVGIGTNLSCYGGVIPTRENMEILVEYADTVEKTFNIKLDYISAGNSSSLSLIAGGKMPKRVNHLRIGEAILLGRETIERRPWPGTTQDAFILSAEIIELKEKPSVPIGKMGQDAFGKKASFKREHHPLAFLRRTAIKRFFPSRFKKDDEIIGAKRQMVRAILNVGREDVIVEGMEPIDRRQQILGASSDHLIVDVTRVSDGVKIGGRLGFLMNYGALLATMTSSYVEKKPILHGKEEMRIEGIHIIGVPLWVGSGAPGVEYGPKALRQAGLVEKLRSLGLEVVDMGDVPVTKGISGDNVEENIREIYQTAEAVAALVVAAIEKRHVPLVLGGDDSVSLGVFLGLARATEKEGPFGLMSFDAHGDMLDSMEGKSGRFSRSMLGSALGYGDERLAKLGGISPMISPENVAIVGLRAVEEAEARRISELSISVFTMEDIDSFGMKEVIYRSLRASGAGTSGIYLSLDMDVVDAQVVPGVISPVNGGLTYRETHLAMELVARSGLLRALDVVGIDPERDEEGITAREAVEFILSAFGKKILGR